MGIILLCYLSVEQRAADAPIAVAATFGLALRYLHLYGVCTCREIAQWYVIGVGHRARTPVRAAHIR